MDDDGLRFLPFARKERRLATMHVEGIPDGATAMSRAVALPAAIAARLVLEGEIRASGARMPPTLPELFKPALAELANLGFEFTRRTVAV
ncbi:MAG: saccharopine dehydrogenase C-terminal domain-containing protein [Gemmatimonadales bacterium]